MDKFDLALLEQVQQNSRVTAEQLSESVGLSPSACQRRLNALRKSGVIEKEVAIIAPHAIGKVLTVIVEVTFEHDRSDILTAFKKTMRSRSEVSICYYVTGSVDFVLVLTMRDMEHYEWFSRKFFLEDKNIKRYGSSVVIERVKAGMYVPIEKLQ